MSKAKWILLALVIIGAIALVWFLLIPDPKVVFKQAQTALVNAKSLHYEVSFEVRGDTADTVLKGSTRVAAGTIKGIVATDADFSKFPDSSKSVFSITTTAADGRSRALTGESRKKDGMHYLKLSDNAALEGVEASLVGPWLKTKRPLVDWVFPPPERDAVLTPLDAGGFVGFRRALVVADPVTFPKPTSEKDSAGNAVWHYRATLNTDVAIALLLKLRQLHLGADSTSDDLIAATVEVQSWGAPQGDVLIGKKDRRIHAVSFTTTLAGGTAATLSVSATFSKYGEPVSVDAPEAQDLDKVTAEAANTGLKQTAARDLTSPMASASTTTLGPAPDGAVLGGDDDGDDLSNSQEYFYTSDPWNPDTDADGYGDGYEVAHAMNPIGPGALFSFGLGQ